MRQQLFHLETNLLRTFADADDSHRLALVEIKLTDLEIQMIKLESKS